MSEPNRQMPAAFSWLKGGGETGAIIHSKDWSQTPLGPIESWPRTLTTALSICLLSKQPMFVWWKTGSDGLTIFYNDAYIPIAAAKHPDQIGSDPRSPKGWAEMWPYLAPLVDSVFRKKTATWNENLYLPIYRTPDLLEEAYWSFSYSPIITDEEGEVAGMYCSTIETTKQVLSERRLRLLRNLGGGNALSNDADVARHAMEQIADNPQDMPFALLYVVGPDGKHAQLAATSALDGGAASPASVPLESGSARSAWPLFEVHNTASLMRVDGLRARFGSALPTAPWDEAPDMAVVLPIETPSQPQPMGFLVVGLSPRLRFDSEYESFLKFVTGHLATNFTNARTMEAERRRAAALAEIDRAKTAFFSNVSHEFRTPLTLMLGPLEETLARSDSLTPADRRQLDAAHRNSLRLLKLVNTLLDFSRIEAGRAQAVYAPTDLASATAELASVFRSAIEKAGLRLDVDCPALSEPVYIDRDMWEKIVLNLISNAFKFTFEGGIEVKLRERGRHVELTVRDTGVGVPSDEVPRLFERFHRIAGVHGRTHEGSGIGLALVQELTRLHAGSVAADSVLGQGTAFKVTIPLGNSHLPHERIGAARTTASTALGAAPFVEEASRWLPDLDNADAPIMRDIHVDAPADVQVSERARIVLADDNVDMRDYVRRLFAGRYEVEAVADGEAALAAVERQRPDLVLTDVMMPRLDGMGLIAALRSRPQTSTLPIIVLSARAGEESRVEGMQAGADDYLIKPFSARELLARVEAHLKLKRARELSERALRESEARFRNMADHAPVMVWVTEPNASCSFLSQSWYDFTGQTPEMALGFGWLDAAHPDDRQGASEAFLAANARREAFRLEYRLRRHDGDYIWAIDAATPRFSETGEFLGYIGSVIDISERKKAEETQRMMTSELSHRVKNMLATVQAVATQTLRHNANPADFVPTFGGRIQSLSRVHSMLSDSNWQAADLREIIRDQILSGPVDETKVTAWGPSVGLQPQAATHVAMMLHELGTNSIKYGALSGAKGVVTIGWTVSNNTIQLTWTERGGPPVKAPVRRGFGTVLIEQGARSAGGDAEMSIEAEGVIWRIKLPLQSAPADSGGGTPAAAFIDTAARPGEHPNAQSASGLAGKRILVVEDEPLVALDIVGSLEEDGAEIVGSVGNAREALALIERERLDAALLDGNLAGQRVDAIATALTAKNVPFAFVTGYGRESLPQIYGSAAVLTKPFTQQQLLETTSRLVKRPADVRKLRG